MAKSQYCEACNTVFKNSRSLATHKHKFHSTPPTSPGYHSKAQLTNSSTFRRPTEKHADIAHEMLGFKNYTEMPSNVSSTVAELRSLIGRVNLKIDIQDNRMQELCKDVLRLRLMVKNNSQSLAALNPPEFYTGDVYELKRVTTV